MNKRRRTSSVASRGTEDDPDDIIPEPTKRRKKFDPSDLCHQLYDLLRNHKKEDGSLLCDAFIRVPKRRQEPGYYEVVTNPIDLLKVQQKLKTDEYRDMDELAADIQLMVNNAKAFYMRTSPEYKDATELWEFCVNTKNRIMEEYEDEPNKGKLILKVGRLAKKITTRQDDMEDTSESSTNPDEDSQIYEDLFAAVMLATDPADSNRPLHVPFLLKPSKKLYPEYYDVIEQPIDLKTIAIKIQENAYNNLSEMERDLLLMCRNACHFNEPGSWIYKDAKLLKKIITAAAKRQNADVAGPVSKSMSAALSTRSKRGNRSTHALIAQSAALRDEDEESDDEEEDPLDTEESDNPQWQLFQTIRTAPNSQGLRMSEFFWTLPSRQLYADYYKTIKHPISLLQIRKKIKRGEYGTVGEVAGDMNLVFENAKKYNVHTSRLYKFAVKLQKVMQEKVQELLEYDQESESEEEIDNNAHPKLIKRASNLLTRGKYKDNIPLKKRLHKLVKCVIECITDDGRQPILMFMEKPSKKLYPDYYQVISEPIDMLTIEANIKAEKYHNENDLIQDFKLMFRNCRQYNEVGSLIYEDAKTLEKVLMDKIKELGPLQDSVKSNKLTGSTPTRNVGLYYYRRPRKVVPLHLQKMRTMYDTIKDYHDAKGRQLSLIFMKLPNIKEYPDYYEVIKHPIHMERIASILKNNGYENLDELVSDLLLMFDNACKYNEPDSQIYKDALILQRLVLQTKLQLSEDEESVPDVTAAVQEILATIFTALYNHQDEEGRCYSDSMAELPEHDIVDGKKIRGLSLDLIKRRLDKGVYKRLDRFQEDVFSCLERARKLSRTDSQPFEDSVELQAFFLRTRDEVTKNGDLLHSSALNYTLLELANQVAELKRVKIQQELTSSNEDESCDGNDKEGDSSNIATHNDSGGSMSFNQETYRAGDFAYIEPTERGMDTSVVLIERLWTNAEGQQMLYGNLFYRPSETYHVASRKFLDKELFKSDAHVAVPLSKVAGRCCVLSVKDYFRMIPDGFPEKDVYVCESRYSTKARAFKKIKVWNFDPDHLKLIPRDKPLEPKRVISVYKERLEKHKEEIAELEEGEKPIEKEKPNVILFNADDTENMYYEQYNTCVGPVKLGDFVYVATDGGRQQIAQIDSIWSTKDGKCYFRGPWLLAPTDITHAPTKLFYKQEMFLSTVDAMHPIVAIVGKCAVLDYGEYICSRPTEIPEDDVFICESMFDENKNVIRKLSAEGLKKFNHSNQVTEDEIYFFRKPINPTKVPSDVAQIQNQSKSIGSSSGQFEMDTSPYLPKLESDVLGMGVGLGVGVGVGDDSLDAPPSVGSMEAQPVLSNTQTPVSSKKKTPGKKLVTGYILYSSKMRTTVTQNNPDSTFGEISRMVGNEWRKLPPVEKSLWEERANKLNEEGGQIKGSLSAGSMQDLVYECCWENCDWQFEDMADCIEHSVAEQNGHVQNFFANANNDIEYQCQWRGCGRMKKSVPPFPSVQRLARHVKEVHILKSNGRIVPPTDRSKNFVPAKGSTTLAPMETETSAAATQTNNVPAAKQPEPLFVAVPPRPSRVLHSDAYLRYIEGLTAENRYISNWDKQMSATSENTQIPEVTKLPAEWLGNGVGNHGNVVNALWTLRNMMMRDVLAINKTL